MAITPDITDHDGAQVLGWDGSELSTAGFGTVLIEVTAIVGTVTIKGGIAQANTLAVLSLADTTATLAANISATGIYAVPACGKLTAVIGSSATMNIKWKR